MRAASLSLSLSISFSLAAPSLLIGGCGATGEMAPAGGAPSTGDSGTMTDLRWCGAMTLTTSVTVAAGQSLTLCAGSTLTVGSGARLNVAGRLLVQGTAALPVKLVGATSGAGAWTGVVLDAGGDLSATYLEIHDAETAIAARPRSSYAIDHLVIDNSSAMLVLSAGGTIAHGTLHGLGDNQQQTPVYVSSASPHISDTAVTQGVYLGIDMIVVGGAGSAPVFDHVEVADSHCAFHFESSNGAVISNSWLHHNAYAFMLGASVAGQVVHNNFQDNLVNLGSCGGAALEVADNYFEGAPLDDSCADLAVTGITPPGPYDSGVGPRD
jgi:hypothetical protein